MTSTENPHAGHGMVVLDIGGDIGALVVAAPATLSGVELEICPAGRRGQQPDEGGDWWQGEWRSTHEHTSQPHQHEHHEHHEHHGPAWPHVAILPRPAPSGAPHAAVFPGLRTGRYEVWQRPDGPTALIVDVIGAQVVTAELGA